MMPCGLLSLSLLSLILPLGVLAEPHGKIHLNRHHELSKRAQGDINLFKRYSSARWSFYDVGLGACGKTNVATDYIVALNSDQYGSGYPGPHCFETITMTYNGKTTTATIMDQCPGCPYGGLDLSRGLFTYFAAESVGIIYGEWYFNDGSSGATTSTYEWGATTTSTTEKAATTSAWVAPTTTTWKATTTTSIWTPEATTTSTPTWKAATTTSIWTPDATTTSTTTWKAATTTSIWTPEATTTPTTTWKAATTTSIWTPEATIISTSTTSSKQSSSSSSSAVSSSFSSVATSSAVSSSSVAKSSFAFSASASSSSISYSSGLAVPTGIITTGDEANNLNSLNQLFINLSGLVAGGANAE